MTKIAFAGDSILALGWTSSTVVGNTGVAGLIAATGGDVFDEFVNVSVGGTTTRNLNAVETLGVTENPAQIAQVVSAAPDWCYINAGSNDATEPRALADVMNDLLDACTSLKNAGIKVGIATPLMRSDVGVTTAMQDRIREIASAILAQPLGRYWDFVADQTYSFPEWAGPLDPVVNVALANGGAGDAYVHPNVYGSLLNAEKRMSQFRDQISARVAYTSAYGNFPAMLGNDGAMDGNFSGELATGWTGVGSGMGGVSGVWGQSSDERFTKLTLSGTATTGNLAYLYGPLVAIATATKVRARATLRFDEDVEGICGFSVAVANDSAAVRAEAFKCSTYTEDNGLIPAGTEITVYSPVYTTSGSENLNVWFEMVFRDGADVGGSVTIIEPELLTLG